MELPESFKVFTREDFRHLDCEAEASMLQSVLDSCKKENDIQRYIKDNNKWFIPLSIMRGYDFGHHFSCVVPEYPLGAEYRIDYLLIGKNSIGFQFVLVEFEDVNIDYRIKSRDSETEGVRKGLDQIREWKRWMDKNKHYFIDGKGISSLGQHHIPDWCFHYCLVVSRRSRMDDISNELRGQYQRENHGINIITYDRLVDYVARLTNGL